MKIKARYKSECFHPNCDSGKLEYKIKNQQWYFNGNTCSLYELEILDTYKEIELIAIKDTKNAIGYARLLEHIESENKYDSIVKK